MNLLLKAVAEPYLKFKDVTPFPIIVTLVATA